jgi:hypothetical protein
MKRTIIAAVLGLGLIGGLTACGTASASTDTAAAPAATQEGTPFDDARSPECADTVHAYEGLITASVAQFKATKEVLQGDISQADRASELARTATGKADDVTAAIKVLTEKKDFSCDLDAFSPFLGKGQAAGEAVSAAIDVYGTSRFEAKATTAITLMDSFITDAAEVV